MHADLPQWTGKTFFFGPLGDKKTKNLHHQFRSWELCITYAFGVLSGKMFECFPLEINKRIRFLLFWSAPLCRTLCPRTNCCYWLLKSQKRWNQMSSIWSPSSFSFFSVKKSSSLREKTKVNCIWLTRMMTSEIVSLCSSSYLLFPDFFLFISLLSKKNTENRYTIDTLAFIYTIWL